MNSCASISHRNKERFPWEDILEEKLSRNRSGHRKWTCGFHPVLLSHFPSFSLRPLKQFRSRIGAQPCLRSLHWVLNKGDCGSAGCPPMEAGTLASSTLLLKVWVWNYLWAVLTCVCTKGTFCHICWWIISCFYTVPPVPTTAPKLLEKRSKQLLVMPVESHKGDGPIISTKLLYKPVENRDFWSSIIGGLRKTIKPVQLLLWFLCLSNFPPLAVVKHGVSNVVTC